MKITSLTIEGFRAFQKKTEIKIGENVTCISGMNGVGKSTILAILSNIGELKNEKLLNGQAFRGEFANEVIYDKKMTQLDQIK